MILGFKVKAKTEQAQAASGAMQAEPTLTFPASAPPTRE